MPKSKHKPERPIPVIDLFAGPGGLSEGFSAFKSHRGLHPFEVTLSVEMEEYAHRTLMLRSFCRQFRGRRIPSAYYRYLRRDPSLTRETLFDRYPDEAARAAASTLKAKLGSDDLTQDELDQHIDRALGAQRGAWVLIGGPPCQAYSLAGRSRMRGSEKFANDERHTLYKEYLQILSRHQPAVFVMENVKGLLSATVKGEQVFRHILRDLESPGTAGNGLGGARDERLRYTLYPLSPDSVPLLDGTYRPADYIVKAEEHGIPQARHRIIILGVRSDFVSDFIPSIERKPPVTVEEAIGDLPPIRSLLSGEPDTAAAWQDAVRTALAQEWYLRLAKDDPIRLQVQNAARPHRERLSQGGEFLDAECDLQWEREWFVDPDLNGVCNHAARGHRRDDLVRYLYASSFAKACGRSPELSDFPPELLPKHRNVGRALGTGRLFSDRFRVQVASSAAATITCHMAKDGHHNIHPDPRQCRSLTVREAARLQTFPDNYFFEGSRTSQYQQVGNAVPPLLARQIAQIVDRILRRKSGQ